MYHGKKPNMELWETLSDIIPYYQNNFGIDGARIDMGHALPEKLIKMIISKAHAIDPDFSFIAEELNPKKCWQSKRYGLQHDYRKRIFNATQFRRLENARIHVKCP